MGCHLCACENINNIKYSSSETNIVTLFFITSNNYYNLVQ